VAATPWKALKEPVPDRDYLVLLTYLPIRRLLRLPQFLRYVKAVQEQLDGTDGLVGWSMLARPFRSKYWTLSVWEDDAALQAFVHERPHVDTMGLITQDLSGFWTRRWTAAGRALPPRWDDALAR